MFRLLHDLTFHVPKESFHYVTLCGFARIHKEGNIFIFTIGCNVSILLVIRSLSDVLRAQSRFVKFVGGEAAGRIPHKFITPQLLLCR